MKRLILYYVYGRKTSTIRARRRQMRARVFRTLKRVSANNSHTKETHRQRRRHRRRRQPRELAGVRIIPRRTRAHGFVVQQSSERGQKVRAPSMPVKLAECTYTYVYIFPSAIVRCVERDFVVRRRAIDACGFS